MRVSLFRAALTIFACAACTSEAIGSIPPSRFQFRTIVSVKEGEVGGWRAAQVVIKLGSQYGIAACRVEVGVPFMTGVSGKISEERAQIAAAMAADEAARVVLANPTMSAILCRNFIDEMNRRFKDEIPGGKVTPFLRAGLTPTHWP